MPDALGWLSDLWRAVGDAATSVVLGVLVAFGAAGLLTGAVFLALRAVGRGR